MPEPAGLKKFIFFNFFLLSCLFLSSCSINPLISHRNSHARIYDDFVLVKSADGDTLSSLSANYLKDPNKGWLIAAFNSITKIVPDRHLIIPLSPFNKGGLKTNGYQTVPILVYHNFSKSRSEKTTLTGDEFDAQMKYLNQNNYHVISLDRLMEFLDYKEQLPEKSIVITFDDAWRSAYDIAVPILKKYGFTATFFIYTDFIGGGKALSWKLIKELSETGFDIQCQTKTHRNLSIPKKKESFKKYFESIEMEISYPQKLFKKMLNKDCRYLAYPYGETNNLVIAILKKHGYRGAFTLGGESNPFFVDKYRISRSVIYGNFDLEQFKKCVSVFQKTELNGITGTVKHSKHTGHKEVKKTSKTRIAKNTTFQAHYFQKTAKTYENSDDLQRALFYLKVAGALSPEDNKIPREISRLKTTIEVKSNTYFNKGKKFYMQNRFEEARNQFLAALRCNPDLIPALDYLKNRLLPKEYILYAPGKEDSLKEISKKFYKDPDLGFLIAYFNHLRSESKPDPGKMLKLPILPPEVNPVKIDIHQEILSAKRLLMKKQYWEAIEVTDRILEIDRSNRSALDSRNKAFYRIGMEMIRNKKYLEAVDTFKRISPKDKAVDSAIQNAFQKELLKAENLLKKGNYEDSIHLAENILRYDGSYGAAKKLIDTAYCRQGKGLLIQKKYTEALNILNKADPADACSKKMRSAVLLSIKKEADAHYIRGVKYFLNEDLHHAISEWETTLQLDPTHGKAEKDIKNARNLLEKLKKVK